MWFGLNEYVRTLHLSSNVVKYMFWVVCVRVDRLLADIANSLPSNVSQVVHVCSGATHNEIVHNMSTATLHHRTDSWRFAVSDPYQSIFSRSWYKHLVANTADRRSGDRGSKYGRKISPLATILNRLKNHDRSRTVSNSTSDGDQLERSFADKMAEVKLVLVVMDVLLVLYRLTNLRVDMRSLSTGDNQSNVDHSQSERRSSSRDRRTCCEGDVTNWLVAGLCTSASVVALLPVAMVGGPTHAGIAMSRLVVPSIPASVMPTSGHKLDNDGHQWSADVHRQHMKFELQQLLTLRFLCQLHGTIISCYYRSKLLSAQCISSIGQKSVCLSVRVSVTQTSWTLYRSQYYNDLHQTWYDYRRP